MFSALACGIIIGGLVVPNESSIIQLQKLIKQYYVNPNKTLTNCTVSTKKTLTMNTKFFPDEIKELVPNFKYEKTFCRLVSPLKLSITIMSTDGHVDESIPDFVCKICNLLTKITGLRINEPLKILIIPTDHKKMKPNSPQVLDAINVNTGFYSDNTIVIFRNESLKKVIIHELIHFFYLDEPVEQSLHLKEYQKKYKTIFGVSSDILFFEAYTEALTMILSCMIKSIELKVAFNDIFYKEFDFCMSQAYNVLTYSGYQITQDCIIPPSTYKEQTNVLAYYVIKTILLCDIDYLVRLLLRYKLKVSDSEVFKLIDSNYQNFVDQIQNPRYHSTRDSLRMISFDL